jgi:hypothetical protein
MGIDAAVDPVAKSTIPCFNKLQSIDERWIVGKRSKNTHRMIGNVLYVHGELLCKFAGFG